MNFSVVGRRAVKRGFFVKIASTLLGVAIFASTAAAQDWDSVQVQSQELQPGHFMLRGKGGNLALSIGGDGVLIVDSQFAPLSERILEHIRELGGDRTRFLINTHWHRDHTDGNANFRASGLEIIAHEAVRKRLLAASQKVGANDAEDVKVSAAPQLPVITFKDMLSVHLNGEDVELYFVGPAHTDGDVIVYFTDADVLHMGDTFFNGLYSFFDRRSGGSFEGLINALDAGLMLAGPETTIIPGHGALSDRAGMRRHRDRLFEIRRRVKEAIAAGQSKEAFLASDPTADLEADYSGNFKVMAAPEFLELVWGDLAE